MNNKVRYWSMERFCLMVSKMLLNKFDCFIIVEGNRGLGKSTWAYLISKKIHRYFRTIVKETGGDQSPYYKWYEFKPRLQVKYPDTHKYVLYKQQDVINYYDKWHQLGIADEMINVAFNREFWSEDQKNLIKMINMNRDHGNLLIACVPQFQNLDTQIKNLCKIRVTIVRRGLAVIQTPNRTIYNRDKWDSANNEKIEREWLKRGSGLPRYSKLNTFRGMMRFRALSKNEQAIYDAIKVAERNVIKGDLGVKEDKKEESPVDKIYKKLTAGGIRNGAELEGIAFGMGITVDALRNRLVKLLKKENKAWRVSDYFWDKKGKTIMEGDLFA